MTYIKFEDFGIDYDLTWEDAFDKFGFDDGNDDLGTGEVIEVLSKAGYQVETPEMVLHNMIIISIKKDGLELMPIDNDKYRIGASNPRDYLPESVITLLDEHFYPELF